jgi:hypothetical protein
MRAGISLTSNHPDAQDPRQGARWMIERAAAAHRAGLDSLFVGDHHVSRTLYYQNRPMLGGFSRSGATPRPAPASLVASGTGGGADRDAGRHRSRPLHYAMRARSHPGFHGGLGRPRHLTRPASPPCIPRRTGSSEATRWGAGVGDKIRQTSLHPLGGDHRLSPWSSVPNFSSSARIAASRRSRILTIVLPISAAVRTVRFISPRLL